jgi:hypothetical protein
VTDQRDYQEALREALSIAYRVSPTGVEQRAFTALYHHLVRVGYAPDDQLCELLNAVVEGVSRGDWPITPAVDLKATEEVCADCEAPLRFVARYAAPGHGQSWSCENGHEWSRVLGAFFRPEELVHELSVEDVR